MEALLLLMQEDGEVLREAQEQEMLLRYRMPQQMVLQKEFRLLAMARHQMFLKIKCQ